MRLRRRLGSIAKSTVKTLQGFYPRLVSYALATYPARTPAAPLVSLPSPEGISVTTMMTETAPELPAAEPKAASSAAVVTLRAAAQQSHDHPQNPPVATLGQLQGPPVATLGGAQPQSPPLATLNQPQGSPVATLEAAQSQRPPLVTLDLPPHGAQGADTPLPSFSMQPGIALQPGIVVQQPPAAGAPNGAVLRHRNSE